MSLETEVTKGFVVSLQLLIVSHGDLRERKLLKEWDIYITLEKRSI